MRDLTYYVATSLDGKIGTPDGGWEDFLDAGDHMDVIVDEFADTLPGHVRAALGVHSDGSRFDTVVMGWNTYTPALDAGIVSPYPHLRQIVASRHRTSGSADVTVTSDPVGELRRLREESGAGIWLAGGGTLAGVLIDEIDHLVLKINPVVLGDGVPVFGGATYAGRQFAKTRVREFDSGVVIAEYARQPRAAR